MARFFAQPYARRLARGGSPRTTAGALVLLLLLLVAVTCAMYLRARRGVRPFEATPAEGWHMRGSMERFADTDMYLKVDGAADAYLRFNARQLRFATYTRDAGAGGAAAGGAVVEVYCYDMAAPGDARSAYKAEKPSGAITVPVGDAAYQAGGTVFFVRGKSYVRLIPIEGNAADAPANLELARALAR